MKYALAMVLSMFAVIGFAAEKKAEVKAPAKTEAKVEKKAEVKAPAKVEKKAEAKK